MARIGNLLIGSALAHAFVLHVSLAPAATETVVYSFQNDGKDGNYPGAPLLNVNGTLYGTTMGGGAAGNTCLNDCGTVFSFDPSNNAETVLHSFQENGKDGFFAYGSLIYKGGELYGTTLSGGAGGCNGGAGCGVLFSVSSTTGKERVRHAFLAGADGSYPNPGLVDVDSTIYGTTSNGGSGCSSCGTIFSFDPTTDTETVIHSFQNDGIDGFTPNPGLSYVKGVIYGTTIEGPMHRKKSGRGVVFSLDPATGAESVLYAFKNSAEHGWDAWGDLVRIKDRLYGTTVVGGSGSCSGSGCGTIFSVDLKTGFQTVRYSFQGGTDGVQPYSGLINADGILYGTTNAGGAYGLGTVFSFNPVTGEEAVIHSFAGSPDGAEPWAKLIELNGALYGTTAGGGGGSCNGGCGTIFSVVPD